MNRRILRTLLPLFFVASFCGSSLAQGVVKGTVIDVANQEPLIAATVRIEGTTIGTLTSLDGSFTLNVMSLEGKQSVIISFIGYSEEKITVDLKGEVNIGTIALKGESIGLEEIMVVAAIARDRQTPVAVSTIKAEIIIEKLGTQEFPEILKSTPSVYATKSSGGYGDGRINLRGFDSNNIGVLINGVPVNDMEGGRVYWSNWAGLSDVTRTMQVQRGLGASRLAISSVGGTINIITNSTDAKQGGNVSYGIGNDGYNKKSVTLSTGLFDNGWAITLSGSRTEGDGYIKGTAFEGWSYFFNVSKRINQSHTLSLTAFGAPQWHNQRYSPQQIQNYRNHPDGARYNPDIGYRNGQLYSTAYNYYHKPQISLNHFYTINPKTTLSTSAYLSLSNGGGRRTYGNQTGWLRYNSTTGLPTTDTKLTPDGYLDWDYVMEQNKNAVNGSEVIIANAVNSHDWMGVLSTFNTDINAFKITAGVDLRYYKGYHMYKVEDLLGGEFFLNSSNVNRPSNTLLYKGDIVNYYDLGEVSWGGLFGQAEYVTEQYSGFISGAISNSGYRRTDFFSYLDSDPNQQTVWKNKMAYSFKGGANYNISEHHNVFVNGGYFTRSPFFKYVFQNNTNVFNKDVKWERVFSTELGYGFRHALLAANVSIYRTEWLDKALTRSFGEVMANVTGLNALHQGIEADITTRPIKRLEIKAMVSLGDWQWTDDVIANVFDEEQQLLGTVKVYSGGLHVGDAAQTTASLGVDYEVLPRLKLGFDFNHYDRLYAYFNVENRTSLTDQGVDAWKMPSYQLVDINMKYDFKLGGFDASLFGKVNNLFDTEYIADATDGSTHNFDSATVYFGFGRTWSAALRIKF
jgi:outer membrane receptor for ferrienterochelin and colicin